MKAYDGDKPYIFVSYSHSDSKIVEKYINTLSLVGYRIWYDEGIKSGVQWANYIADKISRATFFLTFFSETAINSENVKDEVNEAKKNRLPMCIVYLDNCKPESGIEMFIGRWQNLVYDPGRSFNETLELIKAGLPNETKESASKTTDKSLESSEIIPETTDRTNPKSAFLYKVLPIVSGAVLILAIILIILAQKDKDIPNPVADSVSVIHTSVGESAEDTSSPMQEEFPDESSPVTEESKIADTNAPALIEWDRMFKATYYPHTYEETKELSSDPADYTFMVSGTPFRLLTPLSHFLAKGWVISTTDCYDTMEIDGDKSMPLTLVKDGAKFQLSVSNTSHDKRLLKDCIVYKVILQSSDISFGLSGNITESSTEEEIDAVFHQIENGGNCQFHDGAYYFRFYETSTNVTIDADVTYDETVTIPFAIHNNDYELPCKLSDFLDNGWTFYEAHPETMEAYDKENAHLISQGQKISVTIQNNAKEAVNIRDAYITWLSAELSPQTAFTVMEKVSIPYAYDEIVSLLGEPDKSSDLGMGNVYYYHYHSYYGAPSFTLTISTIMGNEKASVEMKYE